MPDIIYTITQRKARKTHTCSICGRAVLPGREYIEFKSLDGNRYRFNRIHIHCDVLMNEYINQTGNMLEWDETDRLVEWLVTKACVVCERSDDCRRATNNCLSCDLAIRQVVAETMLNAALRSVRENDWEDSTND